MTTECCGAKAYGPTNESGAYETLCNDCSEPCCSACAASFDQDGGYGEGGQGVRTRAICKPCALVEAS